MTHTTEPPRATEPVIAIALYVSYDAAESAVDTLKDYGFADADITLVARGGLVDARLLEVRRPGAVWGPVARTWRLSPRAGLATARSGWRVLGRRRASGGAGARYRGGLAGLLRVVQPVSAPDIGRVVASGPLRPTLARRGLTGALRGLGTPRAVAAAYTEAVRRGGVLLVLSIPPQHAVKIHATLQDAAGADLARAGRGRVWPPRDPRTEAPSPDPACDAHEAPSDGRVATEPPDDHGPRRAGRL